MPPIRLPAFPARIWNFPGVVWFMTGVSCGACGYTSIHYLLNSPDFAWREEMRKDEDQRNQFLYERAKQSYNNSIFRKLANLRDRSVPGGPNDKDTRIWRI